MNFEFEREIGFINSQPSLAECLTSLPAVLETFQTSSIKEPPTLIPPPLEQTLLSLDPCSNGSSSSSSSQPPPRSQKGPRRGQAQQAPLQPASLAGEFPWMKEKKALKKPSQLLASPSPSSSSSSLPGSAAGSPAGLYRSKGGIGARGRGGRTQQNVTSRTPHPTPTNPPHPDFNPVIPEKGGKAHHPFLHRGRALALCLPHGQDISFLCPVIIFVSSVSQKLREETPFFFLFLHYPLFHTVLKNVESK